MNEILLNKSRNGMLMLFVLLAVIVLGTVAFIWSVANDVIFIGILSLVAVFADFIMLPM